MRLLSPRIVVIALGTWLCLTPSAARGQADLEEPLVPQPISEKNIELRGRYARQWKADDHTLVVLYNGGFRLDMGQRRLTANNAVVWITPGHSEPNNRKYYDLVVYLCEDAQVQEFGGTTIEDQVLLISNLRTYGQIIKEDDAHTSESGELSPLYQQALLDRAAIEQGKVPTAEESPGVVHPLEPIVARSARPLRTIRYELPSVEPAETPDGQQVFVARRTPTRRVYLARDGGPKTPMLEIQADNAVVFPAEGLTGVIGRTAEGAPRSKSAATSAPTTTRAEQKGAPEESAGPTSQPGLVPHGLAESIKAVYLEGDVVLSLGTSFIRASRLYYDFEHDKAVILDAVFRLDLPERNIPLYVRADEIRQLTARDFAADHAQVSTSEFYTPHYSIGAERINLHDQTPRDQAGRTAGPTSGQYEMRNATARVGGWPFLWWPYSKGNFESTETPLKSFSFGNSGHFGTEVETKWRLFNLLGIQEPQGFDTTWRLDYFSKRGPATGIDVDYKRPDYFGLWRSYYIHDTGEDHLGPLRRDEDQPDTTERGRVLWRHRHYLPDDWEVTFEVSYISDPNFLEEYDRREFNEGKDQETLIYLKRARDVDAITLLANWRLLDFVTQTEHLPDLEYRRIGDLAGPFTLYTETRIGDVRRLLDDRHAYETRRFSNQGESDVTFRADGREEAELPLKIANFNLVPFSSVRGSYWDGSPFDGGLWRGLGVYGVRGSTTLSRVYSDIESELFDIHRIRHIIKPDFTAWWANSNARSDLITPFDYGVETIDAMYGATAGVRQTWQTKRGYGDHAHTVDLVTLNLEVGAFGNTDGRKEKSNGWADPIRPEDSRARNYFAGDAMWRISDTTSFLYDFNFDLNDRSFDRNDFAIAVERSPRLSYVFGYRYAGDIHMNLFGGGWNYKLTEKHITTVRGWFDLDRGDIGQFSIGYVRKLPRWYASISLNYDRVNDDVGVLFSIWPEGVPEWTIGSRRYTGLGTSTGIRP